MRLQVFSDIHGDLAALKKLLDVDADYYISAGDIVTWARGFDKVGPLLRERAERVYVLPGNHENESQIESFCEQYGLNPLHGRKFEIDGWAIGGLGYSTPTPFNTPGEYSESEMAARLEPFSAHEKLVMICHCPPKGTPLDEASPGQHFGSSAMLQFLEKTQPAWFFCGHIHEAAGRKTSLGRTQAVNAGKSGYLLEL